MLHIGPYIVWTYHTSDRFKLTSGIIESDVHGVSSGNRDAAHFVHYFFPSEEVSLTFHRIPKLHMVSLSVSPQNVSGPTFRGPSSKDHVRLDLAISLDLIYIVEKVAEEDGMFLVVASSQV